jgi:hypothetical protein
LRASTSKTTRQRGRRAKILVLTTVLGTEPDTPLDVAVRKTLIGLGCLMDDRASGS